MRHKLKRVVPWFMALTLFSLFLFGKVDSGFASKLNARDGHPDFTKVSVDSLLKNAGDHPAWVPPQQSIIKFADAGTNYLAGKAVDVSGKVWTWGYDLYGMQGSKNGKMYNGGMVRIPYFVDNGITIKKLSAGYHHTLALDDKGQLYGWGLNTNGQLGVGSLVNKSTPTPVVGLEDEKVTEVISGSEALTASFALTESGKIYAWGYGAFHMIPGSLGNVTKPKDITSAFNGKTIVDIAPGGDHVLALDSDGKVYSWGTTASGQTGRPGAGFQDKVEEIPFFEDKKVTQISANSTTSLVLTDDGKVYQFGMVENSTGKSLSFDENERTLLPQRTPKEVEYDLTSADYVPKVMKIVAGKITHFILDTNGRVWSWGFNQYYSNAQDGPLTGKLNYHTAKATQYIKNLGDGDTQNLSSSPKAPVFKDMKSATAANLVYNSYQTYGQWSEMGDGLHPTIYDKKYMQTVDERSEGEKNHKHIYPINEQGKKLVYVINQMPKVDATLYQGNFYVAEPDYKGSWIVKTTNTDKLPELVTSETSYPAINQKEQGWINLTGDPNDYTGLNLKEMPFVSDIKTYQSAVLFMDPSGNLYKQSLDGSGSIAWGWDYNSMYEPNPASAQPPVGSNGLYNFYAYEVMFMRGAPTLPPPEVVVSGPIDKIYKEEKENEENISIKIKLDGAIDDENLNLTVEPELKNAKYVVMPYDNSDKNTLVKEPSVEEFNSAYNAATSTEITTDGSYYRGDLLVKHADDWQTIQHINEPPVVLEDDKMATIKENSVVWVYTEVDAYTQSVQSVKRMVYDNFYDEMKMTHQGVNHEQIDQTLYDKQQTHIKKITQDKIPDYFGFPEDTNGEIIYYGQQGEEGKVLVPTFGYDEVSVTPLTKEEFDKATDNPNPQFEYWKWYSPQTKEKLYTLNGVEEPNNEGETIALDSGTLGVTKEFNHLFHYVQNEDMWAKLHYMSVINDGSVLENYPDLDEVMKEQHLTRKVIPLRDEELAEKYSAKEFVVFKGTPPTSGKIDIEGAKALSKEGNAEFTISWDKKVKAKELDDYTLAFIYYPKSMKLNIRQVILDGTRLIPRPTDGFVTINQVDKKEATEPIEMLNLSMISGEDKLKLSYDTYVFDYPKQVKGGSYHLVVPQYYKQVGYTLTTSKKEAWTDLPIVEEKNAYLDYNQASEFWLTEFIKPVTDQPEDYTWGQANNLFGEMKWR